MKIDARRIRQRAAAGIIGRPDDTESDDVTGTALPAPSLTVERSRFGRHFELNDSYDQRGRCDRKRRRHMLVSTTGAVTAG
jgi:hypothetical protein